MGYFDNVALVTHFSLCRWSYIPVCLQGHGEKGFGLKRRNAICTSLEICVLTIPIPKKAIGHKILALLSVAKVIC